MRLKVGEFSRLCQSPVKTLRYYDEIGLFTPAEIDRFTGYRYYTLDQLPQIHCIMALKELGLSLDQITQLVNENLPLDDIHAMLVRQQQELQQRIDAELQRLALVKFHLRQIENEARLPELQIVVKTLQPFRALTLRRVFPTQRDIDQTGLAILEAYARGELKTLNVPMGIAYAEEFKRHDLDYEFVLPVDSSQTQSVSLGDSGTLNLREVPGLETAATYLHQGDYDGLNDASVALQRWAVANGYRLGSQMRMIYFRGPMHRVPPADYLTELQHQIEKLD
jgi:DNA-binding transcriptional MerR regulator